MDVQTQIGRFLSVDLAPEQATVDRALAELSEKRAVQRLWERDPTLWKPRPEDDVELSDRLGWLDLPTHATGWIHDLEAFAARQAQQGTRHAIVCGMGGSSLAPEVFRITFGGQPDSLTPTLSQRE